MKYGCGGDSEKLAGKIQDQLVSSLKKIDKEIPDRGLKERPGLWVLKGTEMPALLVETAFIDNERDARLLVGYEDEFLYYILLAGQVL